MQLRVLSAIACALGRKPWEICLGSSADFLSPNEDSYSWDDIKRGAEEVAKRIYINEELQVDAVLTFPGASSIFCGYVMRLLPLEVFMRLPLYTAIFVDAHTSVSERSTYYWPVHCKLFTILLPRELIEDPLKRIVVIDDCILTGGAMDKLVEFFTERHNRDNVQFACCICFVGRSLANSQLPEIIGLPDLDNQIKIGLPWGDSYCFEDAFKRQ
jgi:hypoxanthine phosphoribosyltransferase